MIHIGMIKPHHAHRFSAKTSESKGHIHIINGFTMEVNGNSFDRHRHFFRGVTSTQNKHYHRFYGETGAAIPLENGGHYHLFETRTYYSYNQPLPMESGGVLYGESDRPRHDHSFSGKTLEVVGEDPFFSRYLHDSCILLK